MARAKALRTAEADAQSDVELLMAPADLDCTHTSLRRAARRLGQLYDEAIAPAGLTSPQALLLAQMTVLGKARHKQMLGLWMDANSRVEAALGAASTEELRSLANRIASEEFLDAYAAGGSHASPRPGATRA